MNYCQFRNQTIKRMIVTSGGGLPDIYQAVEYLESSGTQHIDSGYTPTSNNLRIVTRLNVLSNKSGDNRFFGSQGGSGNNCAIVPWFWGSTGTAPLGLVAVGTSFYLGGLTTAYNTIYDIDVTANNGTFSGDYCGYTINTTYSGTVANGRNIFIFGNNASRIDHCNARFYSFGMYSDGNLKFSGIPCYRKSDNKPGMYDLVTNTFFTNGGTGEFTVGTPVNILPAEYQQVECLESTGNQVIDLGSLWTENLVTTIEFALTSSFTFANTSYLFGGYNSGYAYSVSFPSDTSFRVPVGGNFENFTISSLSTARHIIEYRRGSLVYDGATTTFTGAPISTLRRYLFGRYNGSSSVMIPGIRVYRYTDATSNGTQHDLIPCYRKSDSVTGMYNLIDNTFIQYTGTANFITGGKL